MIPLVGLSFSKLGATVVRVLSNKRVGIGANDFVGSAIDFGGGSSILACLIRLKCLKFSRGGDYTFVPGRRVQRRLAATIRDAE